MVNALLVLAVKIVLFLGEMRRLQDDLEWYDRKQCESDEHVSMFSLQCKDSESYFAHTTHLELLPVRSGLHLVHVCGMDRVKKVGVGVFNSTKRRRK